jgi:hypothetical protein
MNWGSCFRGLDDLRQFFTIVELPGGYHFYCKKCDQGWEVVGTDPSNFLYLLKRSKQRCLSLSSFSTDLISQAD